MPQGPARLSQSDSLRRGPGRAPVAGAAMRGATWDRRALTMYPTEGTGAPAGSDSRGTRARVRRQMRTKCCATSARMPERPEGAPNLRARLQESACVPNAVPRARNYARLGGSHHRGPRRLGSCCSATASAGGLGPGGRARPTRPRVRADHVSPLAGWYP